jgi:hypothetical protein
MYDTGVQCWDRAGRDAIHTTSNWLNEHHTITRLKMIGIRGLRHHTQMSAIHEITNFAVSRCQLITERRSSPKSDTHK